MSDLLLKATPELLDGWCGPVVGRPAGNEGTRYAHVPWSAHERHYASSSGYSVLTDALADVYLDLARAECRDRVARVVATRWQIPVRHTAPNWEEWWPQSDAPQWRLGYAARGEGRAHVMFHQRRPRHMYQNDIVVPALASIPADAPPDLRAARALVLCAEAVGVLDV